MVIGRFTGSLSDFSSNSRNTFPVTIEEKRNGKKQIFIILDEEQKPKEEAIKPDLTSNSTPADSTSTPTNKTNLRI